MKLLFDMGLEVPVLELSDDVVVGLVTLGDPPVRLALWIDQKRMGWPVQMTPF